MIAFIYFPVSNVNFYEFIKIYAGQLEKNVFIIILIKSEFFSSLQLLLYTL
jgi:hypothetical protein